MTYSLTILILSHFEWVCAIKLRSVSLFLNPSEQFRSDFEYINYIINIIQCVEIGNSLFLLDFGLILFTMLFILLRYDCERANDSLAFIVR